MLASRTKAGEESERQIEPVFLICEAKQGGSKGESPLGRRTQSEKGRQGAKQPLEGGKRSFLPPKGRCGKTGAVSTPLPRAYLGYGFFRLQEIVDGPAQDVQVERLGEKMADGMAAELIDGDAVGMGGYDDGLAPIAQVAEAGDQLHPGEPGQPEVGDDQVELQALVLAQSLLGIPG